MNFDDLLDNRVIEPIKVTREEIAYLLRVARRDIQTAEELGHNSLDWAFAIGYNAILQLSLAYMNYLGYRPRGEGKHLNTFKFMERTLDKEEQPMIKKLQQLRRKRNRAIYERPGLVTEKEAEDVIKFALGYYEEIEVKLPKTIVDLSKTEDEL